MSIAVINRKKILNLAAYAITALISVLVVYWISSSFEGGERRQYLGLFLIGAFIFGKVFNWLVLKIFHVDISK